MKAFHFKPSSILVDEDSEKTDDDLYQMLLQIIKERKEHFVLHLKPSKHDNQSWYKCLLKYEAKYESTKEQLDFYFDIVKKYKKCLKRTDIASKNAAFFFKLSSCLKKRENLS